jgi:hypothetical protein
MRKPFWFRGSWLAGFVMTALCMPSWGQANIRTVLLVKVKMGQEDNWKAAVKDYAATVKKAGRTKVAYGKMDEVKALFHDEILPAIKKSGAT